MSVYETIFSRCSCRSYDMTPLPEDVLTDILAEFRALPQLCDDAPLEVEICTAAEVSGGVRAPHYLVVRGQGNAHDAENAGFLSELCSLRLTELGYGSVMLGAANTKQKTAIRRQILIAFGKGTEPIKREEKDFKRKNLAEIAVGDDYRLAAARLAPSGVNKQPWYFIVPQSGGPLYVYKKIPGIHGNMLRRIAYEFPEFDMGIALSHIYLAALEQGKGFAFSYENDNAPPAPKGFKYMGVVK